MSSFKGFSEDEIKKLTTHVPINSAKNSKNNNLVEDEIINSKRVVLKVTKGKKNAVIKTLSDLKKEKNEIPEKAKLSITHPVIVKCEKINKETSHEIEEKPSLKKEKCVETISDVKCIENIVLESENVEEKIDNFCSVKREVANSLGGSEENLSGEGVKSGDDETRFENDLKVEKKRNNLQQLQARQKLIEEQNKKRKEILSKVLADKTKKTREETEKLNEVQREFKTLDALLSEDVNILRKQIDIASLEYMEAQKRYDKVEKEFLDAKFALHQKQERKELLAEHLCAIIEKNEERKAQKLNELLGKLNVLGLDEIQNKCTLLNDSESK